MTMLFNAPVLFKLLTFFLFIRVLYILDPCMKYQSKELE